MTVRNFVIEGVACQLEETASHSSITNFLSVLSYKIKSRSAACKQSSFQLLRAIGILQEFFKNSDRKSNVK